MAEDALACFRTLLDCIPVWLIDFENLASTSVQLQKETLFDRQPVQPQDESPHEPLDPPSPRNSKTSGPMEETERCGSSSGLLRPQLPHLTASDALRLSQRKRKTVSACSDIQSGPLKYRSKGMVVVYYDGNVQKRFENLVRSIGTSRNSLRKGKISAKVAALARAESTGSNSSQDSMMKMKALSYRTVDRRRVRGDFGTKSEETEAFDKADGLLEKAQDLCERGAHQVLRDGDCSVELRQAKELIVEARRVGEDELPKLQKRAEEAAERDKVEDGEDAAMAEGKGLDDSDTPSETLISVVPRTSSTGTCSLEGLEVDTEAEESDDGAQKLALNTTQFHAHRMRRTAG